MIVAAGLLVLAGLGLFVAGLLTGVDAFYWGCVAVCVVAAVLLFRARRQMGAPPPSAPGRSSGAAAPAEPAGEKPPATDAPPVGTAAGATAASVAAATATTTEEPAAAGPEELADPPVEEVEVTDLLLVVDLKDQVLVVDEHPRYHLEGCRHVAGRTTIPLPLDEARTDGFTPCAVCAPDRTLAQRARDRRAAGSA
ncbi:UNVERIFIED_ORG: hypothetical protein E4P37_05600 [Bacillus sp. AZ43]